MACWTVQTMEVEPGKMNLGLLKEALEAQGYTVTHPAFKVLAFFNGSTYATGKYDGNTGKMTINRQVSENDIKQAYSRQVVISQAKKAGWQIKETEKNKFVVVKR